MQEALLPGPGCRVIPPAQQKLPWLPSCPPGVWSGSTALGTRCLVSRSADKGMNTWRKSPGDLGYGRVCFWKSMHRGKPYQGWWGLKSTILPAPCFKGVLKQPFCSQKSIKEFGGSFCFSNGSLDCSQSLLETSWGELGKSLPFLFLLPLFSSSPSRSPSTFLRKLSIAKTTESISFQILLSTKKWTDVCLHFWEIVWFQVLSLFFLRTLIQHTGWTELIWKAGA